MSRALQFCLICAALLLAAGVLSILAIDRYRSRPENVIVRNLGQEVQHDDFAFAVLGSREAPGLETGGATCTTDLVFDIPADAHGLRARVGTEGQVLARHEVSPDDPGNP